jgi:hypothetical protein
MFLADLVYLKCVAKANKTQRHPSAQNNPAAVSTAPALEFPV